MTVKELIETLQKSCIQDETFATKEVLLWSEGCVQAVEEIVIYENQYALITPEFYPSY